MKLLQRIKLAIKFIMLPEHKEKEIIQSNNFMQNHYSEKKLKLCVRCKRRDAVWSNEKCNACSDIGFLE